MVNMTSKVWALVLVILLPAVLIVAGVSTWQYEWSRSRRAIQQAKDALEQDINHSLPNADKAAVLEFLNKRGIRHHETEEAEAKVAYQHPWYLGSTVVVDARTADTDTGLFQCSLYIEFKFDKNAKLLGYRDRPSCSGPF